jgi:hypothetical protein
VCKRLQSFLHPQMIIKDDPIFDGLLRQARQTDRSSWIAQNFVD